MPHFTVALNLPFATDSYLNLATPQEFSSLRVLLHLYTHNDGRCPPSLPNSSLLAAR